MKYGKLGQVTEACKGGVPGVEGEIADFHMWIEREICFDQGSPRDMTPEAESEITNYALVSDAVVPRPA